MKIKNKNIINALKLKIIDMNNIYIFNDVRFTEYQAELVRQKKEQFRSIAVFPCKLRIMKEHIYMSRSVVFLIIRTGYVADPIRVQLDLWIRFRNPEPHPDPNRQMSS
jgi:hypothetical protein